MEPVSENPTRRERGRPAKMTPEQVAICDSMFPEVKTRRGQQNIIYRLRAMSILREDSRFLWLIDPEKAIQGKPGSWRPSILAELGRLEDQDAMRAVALRICELKPKARQAVSMIRRARTGAKGDGDAVSLSHAIIRTISDYLAAHPATTWQQVYAALGNASDAVAASQSPEDQDPQVEATDE